MGSFTWECLDQRACDDCLVSKYLAEHPETTEEQRKEMLECATGEIGWHELPVEEVVAELRQHVPTTLLSDEALTVSIRGVRQWNDKRCRPLVTAQAQNNNEEGDI